MDNKKIAAKIIVGSIFLSIGLSIAKQGGSQIITGVTSLLDRYIPEVR
jgi:hypothetical protein